MKYIFSFIILLIFISVSMAKETKYDFAIPDAPAFTVIQVEPSAILRASSPKEFIINLATNFFSGASNQNPTGIEYNFYEKFKIPLAISGATNLSPNRSLAFGLKYDIWNNITREADLIFENTIKDLLESSNNIISQAEKIVAYKYNKTIQEISSDEKYINEIREISDTIRTSNNKFNILLSTAKDRVEMLNWRKDILSIAVASSFNSNDDSFDKLSINNRRIQFWGIYTHEVGETMQINSNVGALNELGNSIDTTSFSFGLRAYYGSNEFKGLLDASFFSSKKYIPKFEFSLGTEINIYDNYWLVGKLSSDNNLKKIKFTLDIKAGI